MDEFNSEQLQAPPQIIERPMSVTVFGVLNIVFGCYHLFNISILSYKLLMDTSNHHGAKAILILLSPAIGAGFWVWLLILGIGLLKMKRWSRRGSVIYAWFQIGLHTVVWGYTIITFSGLVNSRGESLLFWIAYSFRTLIGMIYPLLLLIFMQTEKVKRVFLPSVASGVGRVTAIGG